MKKQILISFFFLLVSLILVGQSSPIVLVSSTGKITYVNGTKPPMTIASGAVLDPNGIVTLPEKGAAMIFCNGEYKKLSKGKNVLNKLCGGSTSTKSLNIDGRVADFIVSSLQLALVAEGHTSGWARVTDSKSFAGDGWGTQGKDGWGTQGKDGWGTQGKDGWGTQGKDGWGTQGKDGWGTQGKDGWGTQGKDGWGTQGKDGWGTQGKDGWGGIGKKIHLILPVGKLEAKLIRFSWSKPANSTSYKLEIMDENKTLVHSAIVKDTFADVDLKKLHLKNEERYSWMVSSVESAESVSDTYQFAIESMDAKKTTEAKLSKSKIYSKADQTTRSLMETVVLESDNWYYDAAQIFSKLKKKDSKNNLVNMMHAAFWMRSGVTEMAEIAIMP
jgi:hypothetical protein